jgi:hypothetical protein
VYERAATECGVANPTNAKHKPALAKYTAAERGALIAALVDATPQTVWKNIRRTSPLATNKTLNVMTQCMDMLGSTKWLCGQTICTYLGLLGDGRADVACMPSAFLHNVQARFEHERRQLLAVGVPDVFNVRIMLAPWCCNYDPKNTVVNGTHWILVVAIMHARKVVVLDPWPNEAYLESRRAAADRMIAFLRAEAAFRDVEFDGWTTELDPVPAPPKQRDGSACGVFVCFYATAMVLGQPFWFGQQDIPAMREHISVCLNRAAIVFDSISGAVAPASTATSAAGAPSSAGTPATVPAAATRASAAAAPSATVSAVGGPSSGNAVSYSALQGDGWIGLEGGKRHNLMSLDQPSALIQKAHNQAALQRKKARREGV